MTTDEKLKILAGIVLFDNQRVDRLTQIVNGLFERLADGGQDFNGRNNLLRSGFEQSEAFFLLSAEKRAEFSKLFGFDEPTK